MDLFIPSLLAKIIDDIVPTGQERLILFWGGIMILCAGIAGVSSLMLATTDSVVSNVEATLVAFCRALLVTLAGSGDR